MGYKLKIKYLSKNKGGMKKLFVITMLAFWGLTANAQWVQTSLDTNNVFVLAAKGDTIFAGTIDNGVYVSFNNGASWHAANSGLTNLEVQSLAISGNNVFAGTVHGVFLSSNNGSNWTEADSGLHDLGVLALISYNGYIFASSDGVYKSSNNGGNWTNANGGGYITGEPVNAFLISGDSLFAGTNNGIWVTSDNGNHWTFCGLSDTIGVKRLAISGGNIYAGSDIWGIYLSSNNGNSWTQVNTGLVNLEINALAVKGNKTFAASRMHGVYLSTNNGGSWAAWNSGLTAYQYVTSLIVIGDTIFAGTVGYGVWKTSTSEMNGIEEINNNPFIITVYPNPIANNLTIVSPQSAIIEITNLQGQIIQQQKIQQGKTDINISRLAKGVYILRLYSNDKTVVTKIVKE